MKLKAMKLKTQQQRLFSYCLSVINLISLSLLVGCRVKKEKRHMQLKLFLSLFIQPINLISLSLFPHHHLSNPVADRLPFCADRCCAGDKHSHHHMYSSSPSQHKAM